MTKYESIQLRRRGDAAHLPRIARPRLVLWLPQPIRPVVYGQRLASTYSNSRLRRKKAEFMESPIRAIKTDV